MTDNIAIPIIKKGFRPGEKWALKTAPNARENLAGPSTDREYIEAVADRYRRAEKGSRRFYVVSLSAQNGEEKVKKAIDALGASSRSFN